MTHTLKLARRAARLRASMVAALFFALGGCGNPDRVTNTSSAEDTDPAAVADATAEIEGEEVDDGTGGMAIADEDEGIGEEENPSLSVSVEGLSAASAFRGGIPFGTFHLPLNLYGRTYTGSIANISPGEVIKYLEAARRNGAKVMISFSGSERNFIANRAFSMSKWKARVDRYRRLNLSSYINDGTLFGHYLVDEPHDPSNWGGRTIPRATLDEMARYSKQLWPGLPTIVRAWPKFLKGYNYRYLDAAWAQYSARFGNVSTWMQNNVRDAKASRLALVVGLNQLQGGSKGGLNGFYRRGFYSMSASQMRSWGSTILADAYPCAFLSWRYNSRYMNRSDIKSAQATLAGKARSKGTKSCRGGSRAGGGGNQPPPDAGGGGGGSSSIRLKVTGRATSSRQYMTLTWSGIRGSTADVYRDGSRLVSTENDGRYVNVRRNQGRVSYTYKTCQRGTNTCSSSVRVSFR